MRPTNLAVIAVLGLSGCVEPPGSAPASLQLEPAQPSVVVVDGHPVVQPFVATLIERDGSTRDVTAETTFVLADPAFGSWWSPTTLEIHGHALGPVAVRASHGELEQETTLTVYARLHRIESSAPVDAPVVFQRAVQDTSCEPRISYPSNGTVMPRNLGNLDIQWWDGRDDLFQVSLATTYLEYRLYTGRDMDASAWTQLSHLDWARLASQNESIALTVSGVIQSAPQLACISEQYELRATDQAFTGALYWANGSGFNYFDASHPMTSMSTLFDMASWDTMFEPLVDFAPEQCFGCTVSRDGLRLAVPSSSSAAIYDFVERKLHVPTDGTSPSTWSSATWNPTADKLVIAHAGEMELISDTGSRLAKLVDNATDALDPQLSPDGRWLANVESTGYSQTAGSSIVTRTFDEGTNSFGPANVIVPLEPGTANYDLAWSPDGQWLAFTRATGWGTFDTTAAIWVVKSDGSLPPIQLTSATSDLDTRARWAPKLMTVHGQRMFYVTFDARHEFGEQTGNRKQVWAVPFYPSAPDVVEPAFRLPFQPIATNNRLVQWTSIR